MKNTPRSERLHIGIFGRVNCGKSSILNALTRQSAALVSAEPGTTTDSVMKSMEINGVGPVTFIDTAGFGDRSKLGEERMEKARRSAEMTDVALIVFCPGDGADLSEESRWVEMFRTRGTPVIGVLNKIDLPGDQSPFRKAAEQATGLKLVGVSALTGHGTDELIAAIADAAGLCDREITITGDLVTEGDIVMLVMPQDAQAPSGRLILPQAQTIRELLDKKCIPVCCTPDKIGDTLGALRFAPKLVITDSQVFDQVERSIPRESLLTSFSVLFARYKGDVEVFAQGAEAISRLPGSSCVLIAEACSHAPLAEDIGREKIPRMLRARVGGTLKVDIVSGDDFPADLSRYDLVIHCGACMFNRKHVLNRISRAVSQGVPITNYGMAIAYLKGISDRVVYPKD